MPGAQEAFGKQFRQQPRIDQVFLKATAAQIDKNVTDPKMTGQVVVK
jgi:hypothetical protein